MAPGSGHLRAGSADRYPRRDRAGLAPFTAGSKYVALQTFAGYRDGVGEAKFLAGRVYGFLCIEYSHYDGTTFLKFQPESETDPPIWWWWHDDEPADEYSRKFRLFA